jgi:hypothetical protein
MQQQHYTLGPLPHQLPPQPLFMGQQAPPQYNPYGYAHFGSPAPAPPPAPTSPRGAAAGPAHTAGLTTGRTTPLQAWMATGPPPASAATSSLPPSSHLHHSTALGAGSPATAAYGPGGGHAGGNGAPAGWGGGSGAATMGAPGSAIASLREAFLAATAPQRPAQPVQPYSLSATVGLSGSGRSRICRVCDCCCRRWHDALVSRQPSPEPTGLTARAGLGDALNPAIRPRSTPWLLLQAEEAASWTSKYLKGNEPLRELVNTLLELAFLAPHKWVATEG